jgi:hypothetical protein
MTFNKPIYLLEALLTIERESVRYSHINKDVTEARILLQPWDFTSVTVSD